MTTGPRHRSRVAASLVLCLGLAVSGCSGDGSSRPKAGASPSASTTSSTSARPSAQPAAQRRPALPAAKHGSVGQQAFARYVMALWGYGLRSNDARPLVRLSPHGKPCKGCRPFTASLQQRRKQGWHVDLRGLRVRKVTLKKVADNTYARATVDIPASDSLNRDGSFRNANKAHPDATFEVLMHRAKHRYVLLAFTVS